MASPRSYEIEVSPRGRSLVVTARWSEEASLSALAQGQGDGLVLSYASGFCESSLESLDGAWRFAV